MKIVKIFSNVLFCFRDLNTLAEKLFSRNFGHFHGFGHLMSIYQCMYPYICLSVCVCLPVCLQICSSSTAYLSRFWAFDVYLSMYVSIYMSVCMCLPACLSANMLLIYSLFICTFYMK